MFENHSPRVYELLRSARLLDEQQLEALWSDHRATDRPLASLVIEAGLVEPAVLIQTVAAELGCSAATNLPASMTEETVALVAAEQARTFGVMPLRLADGAVDLLAVDPFNHQLVDDLSFALGRDVRLVVADPREVAALIKRHYGEDETSFADVLQEMDQAMGGEERKDWSATDLEALASQAPVVRFVNLVIAQAVRDRASDLHFEPFESEFKIRYRRDGALLELPAPPKSVALPLTSRIKVLANLNIAERRLPQDGRMKLTVGGKPVDLRVSTLPTQFGESVVLRVLDRSAVLLDIQQLGMPPDVAAGVREVVRRPNGIFVATGPTGSGKTTTLYSALRLINSPDVKILTAEDPVEYEIDGMMQVPINPAVGLTFASALRAFLRQDPDVVMIGEIRDLETAQIAVQASLTGHLVLTTLHTNDAAGAVIRLIDMGVEPFLIASTLEAVLAQRLVRRLCSHCRMPLEGDAMRRAELELRRAGLGANGEARAWRARGCQFCGGTGLRGRKALYEWLRMTEPLRELVLGRAPVEALRQQAIADGMRTLREDGTDAVLRSEIAIEEVLRHT
ncbi:MAG TPA: ATPase, T2SS/T4P/T4SS family [Opitutus sp.]|nr:ATPase, T2SS/T4P/T4SS family [Opitutus sp.]